MNQNDHYCTFINKLFIIVEIYLLFFLLFLACFFSIVEKIIWHLIMLFGSSISDLGIRVSTNFIIT